MSKLHLILAFHNHQPVGNFGHVLEDCYEKSYLPFLEALAVHPGLKVVLHYSGHLLSWIHERHPEATDLIRMLIASGRAEVLSGGFYEPVLPVLPERDAVLQIEEFNRFILKKLGYSPKGVWLAERVWEPQVPRLLHRAGMDYLPVDDYHFKLTGLEDEDLLGYYLTEDGGCVTSVFPGSEMLRYLIPFRTVEEILTYFREVASRGSNPLLTMADDGEKFGVWPETFKHCYENRWLENFFDALEENSDWIETTTFSEYRAKFPPAGRVYLPTASYREMGEWTLPQRAGLEYERVLDALTGIAGERAKQLLRGGIWRSFMVKYPEANHIHKRMWMISDRVHEAARVSPRKGRVALTELWKGQCNDAYWHGIFGGLYLPHLRSALQSHLIRAEAAAAGILKDLPAVRMGDFDRDGREDIVVNTKHLTLAATQTGGSLTEFSVTDKAVNLFDVLSRRPEVYHAKISDAAAGPGEARTIHDRLTVKEEGLAAHIAYDNYRRASLIDRFIASGTSVEELARSAYGELGDFVEAPYLMRHKTKGGNVVLSFSREGKAAGNPLSLKKTVEITRTGGLRIGYTLEGAFEGLFVVEMNMSFLGSPDAVIVAGGRTAGMRSTASHPFVRECVLEAAFLGLRLDCRFDDPISLWHYPVETVSLSEQGVERLYQGTALLLATGLKLRGRYNTGFTINYSEVTE